MVCNNISEMKNEKLLDPTTDINVTCEMVKSFTKNEGNPMPPLRARRTIFFEDERLNYEEVYNVVTQNLETLYKKDEIAEIIIVDNSLSIYREDNLRVCLFIFVLKDKFDAINYRAIIETLNDDIDAFLLSLKRGY